MTFRPPAAHRRGGYTMAEMLAVLTLMGILLAIAAPRLEISGTRTSSAMHAVGTTLLTAQRAAVARQHAVAVAFDVPGNTLRIHYDRDNDRAVDAGETVRVEPLGQAVAFGRGSAPQTAIGAGPVSFSGRQGSFPVVVFHRNGTASEEGGFYLTSRKDAQTGAYPSHARAVVIDRATGRASWSSYNGSAWKRSF